MAGGGCDRTDHKLQSLPGKNPVPNTPAPRTTRKLLTAGKGLSAGLARSPRPLEQSLETGRNFPEKKRGGRARPAARWAPAAVAPQLPERQEAPAPPGRPGPRPRAPQEKRAGSRARREPDSRRGRRGDGAPPARGAPWPIWGAHARAKRVTCGEQGERRKIPKARSRRPTLCLPPVPLRGGNGLPDAPAPGPPPARGPRPAARAPPALPSTSLPRALLGASRRCPAFPCFGGEPPAKRAWHSLARTPKRTSCSPSFTPELPHPWPLVGAQAGSEPPRGRRSGDYWNSPRAGDGR